MSNRSLLAVIASMSAVCILIIWTLFSQHEAPVPETPEEPGIPRTERYNAIYDVRIDYPESSRTDYADVTVVNGKGRQYNYRIFKQTAGYDSYSDYLSAHGCSTCALTTILRNVEGLEDLTPDRCISEIQQEIAGEAFDRNFSKSKRKQMPVTLYGAKRIFDEYGVPYRLPSEDPQEREKEITDWLLKGDPVLFTFGNGSAFSLSKVTHTVLLLGIDDEGYVIMGDSLHKSRSYWGNQGLVKTGKMTVADMLSIVKNEGPWSVCDESTDDSHFFYRNPSDRGYLLVRFNSEFPAAVTETEKDTE